MILTFIHSHSYFKKIVLVYQCQVANTFPPSNITCKCIIMQLNIFPLIISIILLRNCYMIYFGFRNRFARVYQNRLSLGAQTFVPCVSLVASVADLSNSLPYERKMMLAQNMWHIYCPKTPKTSSDIIPRHTI